MNHPRSVILVLVGLVVLLPSIGCLDERAADEQIQAQSEALTPSSPSALDPLKLFLASWHCEGVRAISPTDSHATITFNDGWVGLGGVWLVVQSNEKATAENPTPLRGRNNFSYNAALKQFESVWYDSSGGWAHQTSPGWDGNNLVFTGEYHIADQVFQTRGTTVRVNPRELLQNGEVNVGGVWFPNAQETCRR